MHRNAIIPPLFLALWTILALALPATAQLTHEGEHLVTSTTAGGAVEEGDRFGTALAAGDFDCDGFEDLAIGAPNEDVVSIADAGAVFIVYGSADGLAGAGARTPLQLHQDISGVNDSAEPFDHFGAALAVGEINGDACADLAVGVPGENIESTDPDVLDAGVVHVWTGTPSGFLPLADGVWSHSRLVGAYLDNANFGAALVFGDLDDDGGDDLVVGSPGAFSNYGTMDIIYSAGSNLSATDTWGDSAGNPGGQYGTAMATGYFDGDDIIDLVVAAPYTDLSGGFVVGYLGGSTAGERDFWDLNFGGGSSDHDLGTVLAAADTRCRGLHEVVFSDPVWDTSGATDAGAVSVYDRSSGLDIYRQGENGVEETAEPFDRVASALATGDFDGDGCQDVAFGVASENLLDSSTDPLLDAGIVQVLYGDVTGLKTTDDQVWSLSSPGIFEVSFDNDRFGDSLATGDFDGDGIDDLAIGVPGAFWGGETAAGFVQVIYGSSLIFSDGFESGTTSAWL